MRQMDFVLNNETVDRLAVVKRVVGEFIDHRQGDRLGLILFGGRPYLRAPLSHDHRVVKELLEEAEIALAGEYTAVGDAIGLAIKRMRALPADSRALVLLTDGGNNSGNIGPRQAADIAAEFSIRIHAVGIGRPAVAAPNPYGIWSSEGAADFDREVLESLAGRTGGVYFHVLDTQGMQAAYAELDRLEPALGKDIKVYYGTALYPWPLGAALILSVWMVFGGGSRPWNL
jgi:Ca-activated chloride channel family protein